MQLCFDKIWTMSWKVLAIRRLEVCGCWLTTAWTRSIDWRIVANFFLPDHGSSVTLPMSSNLSINHIIVELTGMGTFGKRWWNFCFTVLKDWVSKKHVKTKILGSFDIHAIVLGKMFKRNTRSRRTCHALTTTASFRLLRWQSHMS